MFVPEAYITATRQFVAQANNWSLEELSLEVTITVNRNMTRFFLKDRFSQLSIWLTKPASLELQTKS